MGSMKAGTGPSGIVFTGAGAATTNGAIIVKMLVARAKFALLII